MWITGMWGIGDNLHQRAPIRELMQKYEVHLETCHVALYHDLIEQGLRIHFRPTRLRAQTRTIEIERERYPGAFNNALPPNSATRKVLWYKKPEIDKHGSILHAMYGVLGLPAPQRPDFSLPIKSEWRDRARALIASWRVPANKPLLVYRPIVLRKEWDGKARNPEPAAFAELFGAIRERFFVISIADLAPNLEWIVGPEPNADIKLHSGELDFETMAALFAQAQLIFSPAGFAPVLAQAVGTPSITVYGGRESFRTTQSAGAHLVPSLGIDPDHPCDCHAHNHACDKRITLPPALSKVSAFVEDHVKPKPRVLIFGTTYVDSEDRRKLTLHWVSLHRRLNPGCDLLLVDSSSPLLNANHAQGVLFYSFPDNVGHLSRGGRDGWGRAFCYGLQAAINGGYDYVAHIEGDSLFRLPVMPIVRQMQADGIDVASVPVRGMVREMPGWVETGLMFFRVGHLAESKFIERYDWPARTRHPTPEKVVAEIVGPHLKMMPWKAWRGDKHQITHHNVVELDLDWVTHCHQDIWAYDRFMEVNADPHQAPAAPSVKLNFGCGTNRLKGWENHDADINISKRLPFPDNHADYVFAEHVVEHIDYYAALNFFKECRRVLKSGGVIRIAVPSIENVRNRGDREYFEFAHRNKWAPTADQRGAMHALLYCHGHKAAWTQSLLDASLYFAGFEEIRREEPGRSTRPDLVGVEGHGRVIGERMNWIETAVCEARADK